MNHRYLRPPEGPGVAGAECNCNWESDEMRLPGKSSHPEPKGPPTTELLVHHDGAVNILRPTSPQLMLKGFGTIIL
ncbi:hypothetical protein EYF80_046381 [Liparis tanakae]|uniref:Uncharacterized protein n=1 Tax=Liparis tanakae TaxID=230148 RepID=A0A4Z2FSS9_9TELE|nr:hypothetical protein EYF80_046381 [Liparis tanakae]